MNRRYFGIPGLLLLNAVLCLYGWQTPDSVKKRFQIDQESQLYLKGTTNVNTFTCDCTDRFPLKSFEVENQEGYAHYQHAGVRLDTRNFNCHNRKIETDLQKAMKSEIFPYISISLVESWQDPKCATGDCPDWFVVKAKVRITITNVTKEHIILGKAKKIGPNRFQLMGEKALQMSEFGIDPPHAMFGMIKVNDWITFHFDLNVQIVD